MKKRYLGDAVHADFDGYSVILTTENGDRATNKIYLELDVVQALEKYLKELRSYVKSKVKEARDKSAPEA